MSQPDFANPGRGPVDPNCKPRVFSRSGKGGVGKGDKLPLWGILAVVVVVPHKILEVAHWEWTMRMANLFIAEVSWAEGYPYTCLHDHWEW